MTENMYPHIRYLVMVVLALGLVCVPGLAQIACETVCGAHVPQASTMTGIDSTCDDESGDSDTCPCPEHGCNTCPNCSGTLLFMHLNGNQAGPSTSTLFYSLFTTEDDLSSWLGVDIFQPPRA